MYITFTEDFSEVKYEPKAGYTKSYAIIYQSHVIQTNEVKPYENQALFFLQFPPSFSNFLSQSYACARPRLAPGSGVTANDSGISGSIGKHTAHKRPYATTNTS